MNGHSQEYLDFREAEQIQDEIEASARFAEEQEAVAELKKDEANYLD